MGVNKPRIKEGLISRWLVRILQQDFLIFLKSAFVIAFGKEFLAAKQLFIA
jgi:hypothetical protein